MRPASALSPHFAALLIALPCLCRAQGILQPRDSVREWPFAVKSVRVTASISGGVAETTIEQTFQNRTAQEQEGTYLFPVPAGAALSSCELKAGDQVLEGRLLGKEEARGIYESIVRRRKDPALLEYAGTGLFRASIFPIPPHGERTLRMRMVEVLPAEGGLKRFVYPLSTARFSSRAPESLSVHVRLKSALPLKAVYSPSHDVSVRRPSDREASASWEGKGEFPDRDFALYYSAQPDPVGLSLLVHRLGKEGGTFLLVAAPRAEVPDAEREPKQVVFVLDRTGSMAGNNKMQQAKTALNQCLDMLRPEDAFSVISFNESADVWNRNLVPASAQNLKKAHAFVSEASATGGTNIGEALDEALELIGDNPGRQRMVVFLTDGLPTVGETNPEKLLERVRNRTAWLPREPASRTKTVSLENAPRSRAGIRVFCFGVGYDVNVPFLDRLAEATHADADYVRPEESVESIVSTFFSKVTTPALSGLELDFEGMDAADVYPKRLPDLFSGGQIVVAGRFRGEGPGSVRLSGYQGDRRVAYRLPNALETAASSSLVPRIWAARKIGYLLDEVRLHQNREVVDEIVRLSREYGILTPYTSYLADERQDRGIRAESVADGQVRFVEEAESRERALRESRTELYSLGTTRGGESGADSAFRSLNAKGYQQAGRAPSGPQGPSGPGGFGGGLGGMSMGGAMSSQMMRARKDLGLDYAGIALQGKAASQEPGYKQVRDSARVQAVGNRVFYRRGAVWFDSKYVSGARVTQVRILSEGYFKLVRSVPEVGKLATVGDNVVLALKGGAVQIGPAGKETLTDSEIAALRG